MVSRRTFIARTSLGGFGLYLWSKGGATLLATMAGSPTLEASSIDQFVTPLLVPLAMPRAGRLAVRGEKNIDYYEIAVRQFQQQMLPASWPATTVWGRTWPFLDVEQRRYRFRLLNGCNSRFLILDFTDVPGVDVWQIGTEGGFLAEPVHTTGMAGNRILLSPAERVDVIVDFTSVPTGHYTLANVGPDESFGGGEPGVDFEPADAATTGRVLQFRVRPIIGVDTSTPPEFLQLPTIVPLTGGTPRGLALLEHMSHDVHDAPVEALLGTVSPGNGAWVRLEWADAITENPHVGDTEVWEFFNATEDAHPIHIHETQFQVVDRQAIVVDETHGTVRLAEGSVPRKAEPGENGWKDTVIAYPGEVTRVRATFETPGLFVWHCHIVEHEDNEMMRPYRIGPPQPGSPG